MAANGANADNERARLYWQCRRGMLELDTLLQGFLEQGYMELDEQGQRAFNELLDYPDTELLEYLMGRQAHKEVRLRDIIEAIRSSACR